jgi:hypothetical protein
MNEKANHGSGPILIVNVKAIAPSSGHKRRMVPIIIRRESPFIKSWRPHQCGTDLDPEC